MSFDTANLINALPRDNLFYFSLILIVASVIAYFVRLIKQPLILAYIFTGIILSQFLAGSSSIETIRFFSELGIAFLLFLVGIELSFKDVKHVGRTSLITGIGQIIFTFIIGYLITKYLLNFSVIESVYISIALTFSSTIIIVKLLSEKQDLQSLYGRISVGFLLVQDFVAIVALIFLSGFTGGGPFSLLEFFTIILKAVVLFGWVILLSWHFLPYLINKISHSPETLFLFSIAWAFGLSDLVTSPLIGFSIEIG